LTELMIIDALDLVEWCRNDFQLSDGSLQVVI